MSHPGAGDSARPPRNVFVLRLEHLYLLLALSATGFLVGISPVLPHDFWWHLRVGQLIAEQGAIPQTNLFAWSLPSDAPYVYAAWLGEWLLFIVHRAGGLELVIFTRNLLVLATLTLVAIEARRRSGSLRLAALAAGLAGAMALNNLDVRPQMWVWVLFALHVTLLSRYADRALRPGWLLVLPLLEMFWVNVHGSFAFGLALTVSFLLGEAVRRQMHDDAAWPWRGVGWLGVVSALEGATILCNPQGVGIVDYVRRLVGNEAVHLLSEWNPPAPTSPVASVFFGSVLLLLVAAAYAQRRPTLTAWLLTCGFLWLAWSAQRNVVWFGLVAMPVLAQCLARGPAPNEAQEPLPPPSEPVVPRRGAIVANWALAVTIVVPVILAQPWLVRTLPAAYTARMLEPPAPPLLATETPFAATAYLEANPGLLGGRQVGGRLFNESGYGSYLIFALPAQPVFADPRVELFPSALWADYFSISRGQNLETLLEKYGIDRILLSRQEQPPLATALSMSPSWVREYADNWAEIWRRTNPSAEPGRS